MSFSYLALLFGVLGCWARAELAVTAAEAGSFYGTTSVTSARRGASQPSCMLVSACSVLTASHLYLCCDASCHYEQPLV